MRTRTSVTRGSRAPCTPKLAEAEACSGAGQTFWKPSKTAPCPILKFCGLGLSDDIRRVARIGVEMQQDGATFVDLLALFRLP